MAKLVRQAGPLDDEFGMHALPLDVLVLKTLGAQSISWDSDSLYAELEELFGTIGPVSWERIQAMRTLHVHDAFWTDWEVFEKIIVAIRGEIPIFDLVQNLEPEDMAVGMEVATRVDTHEYSKEVRQYIVAECLDSGLWYLEGPLAVGAAPLAEYDRAHFIERDHRRVAAALESLTEAVAESEDPVVNQASHVLYVRGIREAYWKAVDKQLRGLDILIPRSKLHRGR